MIKQSLLYILKNTMHSSDAKAVYSAAITSVSVECADFKYLFNKYFLLAQLLLWNSVA